MLPVLGHQEVSGNGAVFQKTLLFSFFQRFDRERKYAKNTTTRQPIKTGLKNIDIVNIAGIPLETWRSKVFQNADSAFVSKTSECQFSRGTPAMVMILVCFLLSFF